MSDKKKRKEWKDLSPFEKLIGIVIIIFVCVAIFKGLTGEFDDDKTSSNKEPETKETSRKINDDTEKKEVKKEKGGKQVKEKKVEEEKTYSLGFNPDEFKDRFNSFSKEIGSPFSIDDLEIKDGEVQDVASIMLNDNIAINLTVNKKDGSVRDFVMIGQGDGSQESGYDLLLTIGTLISITNPDLDEDGRGDVLKGLGLTESIPTEQVTYEANGILYTISSSEDIGIIFTGANADDK